ncbi:MAG: tetratricopeptide repeat protein [Planctomycetales bacterium]
MWKIVAQGLFLMLIGEMLIEAAEGPQKPTATTFPKREGYKDVPKETLVLAVDDFTVVKSLRRARCGSLAREFFRQAVLIAARDELGTDTLDVALDEVALSPDATDGFPLHVDVLGQEDFKKPGGATFIVKIFREDTAGKKFEWKSTPHPSALQPTLEMLAEKTEALSRGELVKGLQEVGYQKSHSTGEQWKGPQGCGERLDAVSQFARLRELHSERRVKGETADNLGALVRAYANLGDLTEPFWSPMSKALRARAILYAHRMIAKYGKTPVTLAHRAYAWALAGNHGLALADLKAIGESKSNDGAAWVPLIAAFCEYRPQDLKGVNGEFKELALYLRMRVLDPNRDEDIALGAMGEMLRANPSCLQVWQQMGEVSSLSVQDKSMLGITDTAWVQIYARLNEMPGLPSDARELAAGRLTKKKSPRGRGALESGGEEPSAEEQKARVGVIRKLCAAKLTKEAGIEPSWRMLGEILNEANYLQALHVLSVETNTYCLPVDDRNRTIARLLPLVEPHRFGKFLLSFGDADPNKKIEGLLEICRTTPGTMYEIQCMPLVIMSTAGDKKYFGLLWTHVDNHWDRVQWDLERAEATKYEKWVKEVIELSPQVMPNQPWVVANMMYTSKTFDDKSAEEWEKKFAKNAMLLKELARKYRSEDRSDEAIRCLEKSIKLSPSHDAYNDLAAEYEKTGDLKKAERTLETAIRLPSDDLGQATACDRLAKLLMREGEWKKGRKYAEAAAQSYSAWGLMCAARAAEGLKDWKRAEEYYQLAAERYDSMHDEWYKWCLRTKRGNMKQAFALAEKDWKTFENPPIRRSERMSRIIPLVEKGDLRETMRILSAPINWDERDPFQAMMAAIIADGIKQPEVRDKLLLQILADKEAKVDPHSYVAQLVRLVQRSVKERLKSPWNKRAFEEIMDEQDEYLVPVGYYLAGQLLETHGEHKLAEEYLKCAATGFNVGDDYTLLATLALRTRGITIGETRLNVHPDSRAARIKLIQRGYYARKNKKFDLAEKNIDEAINRTPQFVYGYLSRGRLRQVQGNFKEAAEDYREALKLNPDSEYAPLHLATILAACSDDKVRDGKEAIKLTEQSAALFGGMTSWHKWVLAAAHAELGDFKKAVELQEAVVKESPNIDDWNNQLALYKAGKPYRYDGKTTMPHVQRK